MTVIYYPTQSEETFENLELSLSKKLEPAIWMDLLNPSKQEELAVEKQLQFEIPTKKEIETIEPSSRLYVQDDILYMTATMLALSDLPDAQTDVVTFILTADKLVTVRYIELKAFNLFKSKLKRSKTTYADPLAVLIELLDTTIERLADILEKISHTFDDISKLIFHEQSIKADTKPKDYKEILKIIGINGDLSNKASESIVSLIRLISFLDQAQESKLSKEHKSTIQMLAKDIHAINDYANFLSTKFNFLLDATLGMINIQQNDIIKIFSVAAVVFLPPTLIATIYGMNFSHIPELNWRMGYPFSLFLMILSAWLPYRFFKKKKWF